MTGEADLRRAVRRYQTTRTGPSVSQALTSFGGFFATCAVMYGLAEVSLWLAILPAPVAAGFLVGVFIIQHDCGHGSFFRRRRANDALGRTLGVLTLTPYAYWRRSHAIHHATSGNLDRRGIGDIDVLTVAEYRALSTLGRWRYRFCRHPPTMLGLGPAYPFFLKQRLPIGQMRGGWQPWRSVMGTNLAIALVVGLLAALVGWQDLLMVQVPVTLLAGAIGIWLFYVQHQFERTYWARDDEWDSRDGALHGSSHYDLPPVLRGPTANIGLHHQRLNAMLAAVGGYLFGGGGAFGIVDDHMAAILRQRAHGGRANAAGGAGDDGDGVFDFQHERSVPGSCLRVA